MEAIKIAVRDDEKNIRSYICSLVRKQGVECDVTEYATAEDYLLAGADYDLLFLDVELKGPNLSMDGMEMAKRIRAWKISNSPSSYLSRAMKNMCMMLLTWGLSDKCTGSNCL